MLCKFLGGLHRVLVYGTDSVPICYSICFNMCICLAFYVCIYLFALLQLTSIGWLFLPFFFPFFSFFFPFFLSFFLTFFLSFFFFSFFLSFFLSSYFLFPSPFFPFHSLSFLPEIAGLHDKIMSQFFSNFADSKKPGKFFLF